MGIKYTNVTRYVATWIYVFSIFGVLIAGRYMHKEMYNALHPPELVNKPISPPKELPGLKIDQRMITKAPLTTATPTLAEVDPSSLNISVSGKQFFSTVKQA